jgi:hypothetical protein
VIGARPRRYGSCKELRCLISPVVLGLHEYPGWSWVATSWGLRESLVRLIATASLATDAQVWSPPDTDAVCSPVALIVRVGGLEMSGR